MGKEKVHEEMRKMLCDTLVTIGKTCMKELQTCFRREDVVRTTTSHLESMKGFLVSIAGNKVRPGSLDSCDATTGLDFGPEDNSVEDLEEGEEYGSYEGFENEMMTQEERAENQAVIEKALNKPRNELSDEPQKDLPPKELTDVPKKLVINIGDSSGQSPIVHSPLVWVISVMAVTRLSLA